MIFGDSVTRLRAPLVTGPYGNELYDWPNATSVDYAAEVQPVSSTEDVVNQPQTVTRWRMFLLPDANVKATDRIVWAGLTLEVDGEVEQWRPRGRLHHFEAVLKRVSVTAG